MRCETSFASDQLWVDSDEESTPGGSVTPTSRGSSLTPGTPPGYTNNPYEFSSGTLSPVTSHGLSHSCNTTPTSTRSRATPEACSMGPEPVFLDVHMPHLDVAQLPHFFSKTTEEDMRPGLPAPAQASTLTLQEVAMFVKNIRMVSMDSVGVVTDAMIDGAQCPEFDAVALLIVANFVQLALDPQGCAVLQVAVKLLKRAEIRSIVPTLKQALQPLLSSPYGVCSVKALCMVSRGVPRVLLVGALRPVKLFITDADLARWCETNPAPEQAIVVYDKGLTCFLTVPITDTSDTVSQGEWLLKKGEVDHLASVCINYQNRRCRAAEKCNMIHIERRLIRALRPPTCCRHHGDVNVAQTDRIDTSAHDEVTINVWSREMKLQVPIKYFAYSAGFVAVAKSGTVSENQICRQHQKEACGKATCCKFVHICRERWSAFGVPTETSGFKKAGALPTHLAEMRLSDLLAQQGMGHLTAQFTKAGIATTEELGQALNTCQLRGTLAPQEKRRLKNVFKTGSSSPTRRPKQVATKQQQIQQQARLFEQVQPSGTQKQVLLSPQMLSAAPQLPMQQHPVPMHAEGSLRVMPVQQQSSPVTPHHVHVQQLQNFQANGVPSPPAAQPPQQLLQTQTQMQPQMQMQMQQVQQVQHKPQMELQKHHQQQQHQQQLQLHHVPQQSLMPQMPQMVQTHATGQPNVVHMNSFAHQQYPVSSPIRVAHNPYSP